MNTGQIINSKTNGAYTVIPKGLIDSDLTFEEKGLLICLLSLPQDWVIYRHNLKEKFNQDKPGAIDRVFRSLQSKGYIISVKVINNLGHFTGWNHIVYNQPQVTENEFHRDRVSPMSGFTEVGKTSPILNTNSILNTNIKQNTKISEPHFEDDESNEAWGRWVKYRKEIRKPLSPSTTKSQVEKLRSKAPHTRAEMINRSIENGWQGLFEPNAPKKSGFSEDEFLAKLG